jgi:hypothetical protein
MINLKFGMVVELARRLEAVRLKFKSLNDNGDGARKIGDADGIEIQNIVKLASALLKEHRDNNINHAIDQLSDSGRHCKNNSDVYAKLEALLQSIKVFFDEQLVYAYPPHKTELFLNWHTNWDIVHSKFPETERDIMEGVDCWALEHSTACVFHVMRILENGLTVLAVDLGVDPGFENWQNIIEQMEKKIRSLGDTLPKGVEKTNKMQFLSEAAKELRYFKDGWRNHVSHNRSVYDEHQARSIMEHVRVFMITLARRP